MDWLTRVEQYLIDRLKVRMDHQTEAMRLLNRYPLVHTRFKEWVPIAATIIENNLESIDGEIKSKLTPVSVGIGSEVMNSIKCSRKWKNDTFVKVGDFIVEGFFQCNYVDIQIPPARSNTPVYIVPTGWDRDYAAPMSERVLKGLYSEPPGQLNLVQKVKWKDEEERVVPVIKRWGVEDEIMWNQIKHGTCFKAAEKLSNVGWTVNEKVWEAVQAYPNFFYKDNKDPAEVSKQLEYVYTCQTVNKVIGNDFYYSVEFDYRGRLYFTCPYFNFQGSDLSRGLLLFSEKRYVTSDGLRWLKIHSASSYNQSYSKHELPEWLTTDYKSYLDKEGLDDISVDKMTLTDRELWVDNNWDLIEWTVADNMLHDCEKPVSFLATCHELVGYERANGFYWSQLPIPVDGSNNGWQHLGAISKDPQTGKLVGLQPIGIQQDFYVKTAKKLIELTKHEERAEILASMPMKHIRKGISKRGSMTRAYSAGAQKIAENMWVDCCKHNFQHKYGITEKHCDGFARDLVEAIKQVCPGPLETMSYLQDLAKEELERGQERIVWSTPAGFPVEYTCWHTRKPTIRSKIRGVNPRTNNQIGHKILLESDAPDRRGFACGISPNFIHSQDAAHMCIVIDKFDGAFGAVHDSFSTHAADVDKLLDITKEVFIDMYNHENYFDDIAKRVGCGSQATQPAVGDLNLSELVHSDYFFA